MVSLRCAKVVAPLPLSCGQKKGARPGPRRSCVKCTHPTPPGPARHPKANLRVEEGWGVGSGVVLSVYVEPSYRRVKAKAVSVCTVYASL